MKIYNVWIEIEEYDQETTEVRDLTELGEAEPVKMAVFSTLAEAVEFAESYDFR